MRETKHTPGEWYFEERTCYVRTDDVLICGVYNPGDNAHVKDAERSANGHLLAGALKLLEACKTAERELLTLSGSTTFTKRMLRSAIAKAEVQS